MFTEICKKYFVFLCVRLSFAYNKLHFVLSIFIIKPLIILEWEALGSQGSNFKSEGRNLSQQRNWVLNQMEMLLSTKIRICFFIWLQLIEQFNFISYFYEEQKFQHCTPMTSGVNKVWLRHFCTNPFGRRHEHNSQSPLSHHHIYILVTVLSLAFHNDNGYIHMLITTSSWPNCEQYLFKSTICFFSRCWKLRTPFQTYKIHNVTFFRWNSFCLYYDILYHNLFKKHFSYV